MPFEFYPTEIPEVIRVIPRRFRDARGSFAEVFKSSVFSEAGIEGPFLQDNCSVSSNRTLRGLHYQVQPFDQGKLVRVSRGVAVDVAVDIRRHSRTFGAWVAVELSALNGEMLWIPCGFAHGFASLEDDTHLNYKCTAEYHKESERSIRWNDPDLAIDWPKLPANAEYRLSEKDASAPYLSEAEVFP